MIGLCVVGAVTLHLAMGPVLAANPQRVDEAADGYFAPLRCQDLGKRYRLIMGGQRYTVRAADCATWQAPAVWPQKRTLDGRMLTWLGDVDVSVWQASGVPMAPAPAILCEVADGR